MTTPVQLRLPSRSTILRGAAALIAALVLLHILGAVTESSAVEMDEEGNVPSWFASAFFLLAAVACVIAHQKVEAARPGWLAVAVVVAAFSLDESAALHERFESRSGPATGVALEALLAVASVAVLWLVMRRLGRPAVLRLSLAAGLILVAQVLGAVNGDDEPRQLVEQVLLVLEEVLELAAAVVVALAALEAVEREPPSG